MAKGRVAWFISDRSGLRRAYPDMIQEPGTGSYLREDESDGAFNRIDHPQNIGPFAVADNVNLDNVYGDHAPELDYLYDDIAGILCFDSEGDGIWMGD